MPGYYVPGLTAASSAVEIAGEEFHHIAHVMRHGVGDALQLSNGTGVLALATIERMGKRALEATITSTRVYEKSTPRLACAFSLLRSKHDHMIVEKLTELGVHAFFPFTSQRSVRQPSGNTAEKFAAVAVAAMKQCDGAFLPTVHGTRPLRPALEHLQEMGYTPLVASEAEQSNLLPVVLGQVHGDVCLVIGPEGGWSDEERAWFASAGLRTVSLGNHILRAETAAIAGAAMVVGHNLHGNHEFY